MLEEVKRARGAHSTAFDSLLQRTAVERGSHDSLAEEAERLATELKLGALFTWQVCLSDSQLLDQVGLSRLLPDPQFSDFVRGRLGPRNPVVVYSRDHERVSFSERLDFLVEGGRFAFSALPSNVRDFIMTPDADPAARINAFRGHEHGRALIQTALTADKIFEGELRKPWRYAPGDMAPRYRTLVGKELEARKQSTSPAERYAVGRIREKVEGDGEFSQTVVDNVFAEVRKIYPTDDLSELAFSLQTLPYFENFAEANELELVGARIAGQANPQSEPVRGGTGGAGKYSEHGSQQAVDITKLTWEQVGKIQSELQDMWRPDIVERKPLAYTSLYAERFVTALQHHAPDALVSSASRLVQTWEYMRSPEVWTTIASMSAAVHAYTVDHPHITIVFIVREAVGLWNGLTINVARPNRRRAIAETNHLLEEQQGYRG